MVGTNDFSCTIQPLEQGSNGSHVILVFLCTLGAAGFTCVTWEGPADAGRIHFWTWHVT